MKIRTPSANAASPRGINAAPTAPVPADDGQPGLPAAAIAGSADQFVAGSAKVGTAPGSLAAALAGFRTEKITPFNPFAPPPRVVLEGKLASGATATVEFTPGSSDPVLLKTGTVSREIKPCEAKQLLVSLVEEALANLPLSMTFTQATVNEQQVYPMIDRLALIPGALPELPVGSARGLTPVRRGVAEAHGLRLRKIDIEGLEYSVVEGGDKHDNKGAVILAPGFPDSWLTFQQTIPFLIHKGYYVVSFDLPGLGDSADPADLGRYKAASIGRDIGGIMERLGVDRYHVVGHDWGTPAAWYAAIQQPNKVRSLFVNNTGHPATFNEFGKSLPPLTDADALNSAYMIMLGASQSSAPDFFTSYNGFQFHDWLSGPTSGTDPHKYDFQVDLLRPGALAAGRKHYQANLPDFFGSWSEAGPVRVPTTGLFPEGDNAYLRRDSMASSGQFVEAPFEFHDIPGAGHWMPLSEAKLYQKLLLAHLERHGDDA
jgi:pimeloyl-ACP methyl ester carboxylesterase